LTIPSIRSRTVVIPAILLLLGALAVVVAMRPASASNTGSEQTFVILYHEGASTDAAGTLVANADGTLVANWAEIGVVIARSSNSSFAATVRADNNVEGASATTNFGTKIDYDDTETGPLPDSVPAPASESDNLTGLQWDMAQIHAFEAHDINGGSPSVLVGDLDTGLDFTHPDLAPNYDAANSTDCTSGTPQPLLPGNDAVTFFASGERRWQRDRSRRSCPT